MVDWHPVRAASVFHERFEAAAGERKIRGAAGLLRIDQIGERAAVAEGGTVTALAPEEQRLEGQEERNGI